MLTPIRVFRTTKQAENTNPDQTKIIRRISMRRHWRYNPSKYNFLTVYSVTRHFGGIEEGGWWFEWFEPIKTIPMRKAYNRRRNQGKVLTQIESLTAQYQTAREEKIVIMREKIVREFQTTHRPQYE
jgi:hypothetical protein